MSTAPSSPDVLVFDLDDTLYPEREFVLSGFRAVGRWMADRGMPGDFYGVALELFDAGRRGRILDEALVRLGLDPAPETVAAMLSCYREHEPEIGLFDDARWALDRFGGRSRLALLTDGYLATQRRKVAALGVGPRFEAIVYSDAFGRDCWKPSPVPYRAVLEALGCGPESGARCAYVADHPSKDFVTARAMGWTTVRVRRPGGEYASSVAAEGHGPDFEVASLGELGAIFGG